MKKILILLLTAVLVFSVVACDKDEVAKDQVASSEELMEKMVENLGSDNNMAFKGIFNLETEELATMGFPSPLTLEMSGEAFDATNMHFNMNLDLGMMQMVGDLYMKDQKVLIHSDMLSMFLGGSYVSMDVSDLAADMEAEMDPEEAKAQLEKMKGILERYEAQSEYSLYDLVKIDDSMTVKEITVNDKKVEATHVNASLTLDNASEMFFDLMAFIATDEEARNLFLTTVDASEIDEMIAQMEDPETRKEIEEALEMLTINAFEMDFYLNDNFMPIKTDINIDVEIEVEGEVMDFKFTGTMETFSIGEVKEIEMPEVDPEQVIDITDMMQGF
jgi:hypothetical protein